MLKKRKKGKRLMLGVFFAGGGFGGRRTFGAEKSTGLEDTWVGMRSFFFIMVVVVVGGIFHFDEIGVDVERDGLGFFFF